MPTYEYKCQACGYLFERLESINARPRKKCPKCKKNTLARLIGPGSGIIFKGNGFYETDYKKKKK
ncbi:MAG: FmdB family zinc ribbon protein [archaeon]